MKNLRIILAALAVCGVVNLSSAKDVKLHINPQWNECSFQFDPALTQDAWHQFTQEAGLITYFRPLTDAKPMGKWNIELSILQWSTEINDEEAAWNDTFVHPDSVHWLKDGPRLGFPGFAGRIGLTDKLDFGVYLTKNFGANYGFWGGQLQYNLVNDLEKKWAASARVSFVSMYGPEDLNLNVSGLDLIASKEFLVYSDWAFISPYVGASTYLTHTHEKSDRVSLQDENVNGFQGMGGAVLKLSLIRLGVEYNFAEVNTVSFKLGVFF